MLHPVFNGLFDRLVARWRTYQEAPRQPERVVELAAARAGLDDARAEIALARAEFHPESAGPASVGRRIAVDADAYAVLRLQGVHSEG